MEIKVLEDKKNRLYFEVIGAGHTLMNALKAELYNDKSVKAATYAVRHPEISNPKMIVETDGADPRKSIQSAVQRLKKSNDKFKKAFTKEVK